MCARPDEVCRRSADRANGTEVVECVAMPRCFEHLRDARSIASETRTTLMMKSTGLLARKVMRRDTLNIFLVECRHTTLIWQVSDRSAEAYC